MTNLLPTMTPERPFLDWPVATDPAGWNAKVALLGIRHSEPYSHDPFPNDQARKGRSGDIVGKRLVISVLRVLRRW